MTDAIGPDVSTIARRHLECALAQRLAVLLNESNRETMHATPLPIDGDLDVQEGSWQEPTNTQGFVITDELFIYNRSIVDSKGGQRR